MDGWMDDGVRAREQHASRSLLIDNCNIRKRIKKNWLG